MARNFFENGYALLWPQVDWGGPTPGFVESEFPLIPFMAAVLYRFLGVHEWIGRALAAAFSLVAGYALFHLVRKVSGSRVAIWAAGFYLFLPLSLYYSRTFMPDAAMMAFSILAIAWFYDWTESGAPGFLAASCVAFSASALLKLPCLYLMLPIAYLANLRFGPSFWKRPLLWAYAAAALTPVVGWYVHAHQILLGGGLTFGIWEYGRDKWGNWSLVSSWAFWNALVFRNVAERWLTWAGFALFLLGLFAIPRSTRERLFDLWLIAVLVFFVIVAKGNYVHEYYQWPLLPAASFYLAKAVTIGIHSRRSALVAGTSLALLLMIALSGVRYASYLRKEDPRKSAQHELSVRVRRMTEPGALLVAVDGQDPTLLYLSHRKGWHANPDQVDSVFLAQRAREGARYVIGIVSPRNAASVSMRGRLAQNYPSVLDDGGLMIYRLPF